MVHILLKILKKDKFQILIKFAETFENAMKNCVLY